MGKTRNGTVTRSEESMTLVTAYGFPHHGNRSFTFVQADALPVFLITVADPLHSLVLLSKSSKVLDHMLRKEYTVYCFEILWIGYMLRYHTDGFPESPTTVSLLLC